MQNEYMAVLDNGWKLYAGTGKAAKLVQFVEGDAKFQGTEIKTWEDIEAAIAVRNLKTVITWPRLVTFAAVA
jgi:hypothetical protein